VLYGGKLSLPMKKSFINTVYLERNVRNCCVVRFKEICVVWWCYYFKDFGCVFIFEVYIEMRVRELRVREMRVREMIRVREMRVRDKGERDKCERKLRYSLEKCGLVEKRKK
jgi:hypothetical protein